MSMCSRSASLLLALCKRQRNGHLLQRSLHQSSSLQVSKWHALKNLLPLPKQKTEKTADEKEPVSVYESDPIESLYEFFDEEQNFGKSDLKAVDRPGRQWNVEELRLKSNRELHQLWFILLKERNMLLTMEEAHKDRMAIMPCPERVDRVNLSMENLEAVVRERNAAYCLLEFGHDGSAPKKTVTSVLGFRYEKPLTEHVIPAHMNEKAEQEYEQPFLDREQYIMQKLWHEKEWWKKRDRQEHELLYRRRSRRKTILNRQHLKDYADHHDF